jgi:serine/threonine protein kinase
MTNKTERSGTVIVGNYELVKKLGNGAYGTVKLGVHVNTGEKVRANICRWLSSPFFLTHIAETQHELFIGRSENHQNKSHQNTQRTSNGRA